MTVESITELVAAFPSEWVAAVTALVAVVLSPLVSYSIARKQITAQVVSVNRQEWINKLRSKIAVFLSRCQLLLTGMPMDVMQTGPELRQRTIELRELYDEIEMMINPTEPEHKELMALLKNAVTVGSKLPDERDENATIRRDEIIAKAQEIFSIEWKRVKKGN